MEGGAEVSRPVGGKQKQKEKAKQKEKEREGGGEGERYPGGVLVGLEGDVQHLAGLVALLVDQLVADGSRRGKLASTMLSKLPRWSASEALKR